MKGKAEAVHIFALLGGPETKQDPAFQALAEHHEAMIAAYRRQEWDKVRAQLMECRALDGTLSVLYDLYDERLEAYQNDPPGPDWDGVFVATSK